MLSGKSSDLVIDQVTVKSYQVTQVSDTSMTRTTLWQPTAYKSRKQWYGYEDTMDYYEPLFPSIQL